MEEYCRRLPGFDEKVIQLFAQGLSTRSIQQFVQEIYGIEVSPELISTVTDAVMEECLEWQQRPLAAALKPIYRAVNVARAEFLFEEFARSELGQRHPEVVRTCADNASAESVFAQLKRELVHQCRFQTRHEAKHKINQYFTKVYNPLRRLVYQSANSRTINSPEERINCVEIGKHSD